MSQPKRDSDGKFVKAKAAKSAKSSKQSTKQTEKRASFVLRLSLDEQNQVRRSEFQHVQSSKKESASTLECERLMAFIESCIGPMESNKPSQAKPAEVVPAPAKTPTPARPRPTTKPSLLRFRKVELNNSSNFAIWSNPAEPLQINVNFVLDGEVSQPSEYTVQIYARSVDKGGSSLVATHNDRLSPGMEQYNATLEIEQLSLGLHQLSAVVRVIGGPMGYCEGLMVQVSQLRVLPVETSTSRLSLS